MADGAYRWQGNAPALDAARVEAIHDGWDDAQAHLFAEPARAHAVSQIDRALAAVRSGDFGQASERLSAARDALMGLDPARLEPRRGLAGLFDSRSKRLKAFREAWWVTAGDITDLVADLRERLNGSTKRPGALEAVWADARDAFIELDAHLLAAARRVTGQPVGDEPHPYEDRRRTLETCRGAVLGALPVLRVAQGADTRADEALKACAEAAEMWRDDWKAALGLSGKRPRKVKPDRNRLIEARDALVAQLDRALAAVAPASARRAELNQRLTRLRESV
ncbi:hypothetical protein GCM10009422_15920 [Brevundimonas kwangchunensis]|uniref:DUF349 domain-containing protein n=1 Tax=Brevundimonas kwangchunensis TaxID=322163 RepID=A0ABP3RYB7_9CAUL